MTADGDINVQPNVPVHYAEGHRIGRSVLISNDFLSVKKIYSLILGGLSAKGEPDTEGFKGTPHILSQISVKDGGFAGRIINVFSGLGAHIHHFPLIHNHHAFPAITDPLDITFSLPFLLEPLLEVFLLPFTARILAGIESQ